MAATPTENPLADVLTDRRLRSVVVELRSAEDDLTISQLAERIAEPESVPKATSEALEIELYHNYVPKLDEAGIVSFDPASNQVALSRDLVTFERSLAAIERTIEAVMEERESDQQ